jgi:hypothetical protein
MRLFYLPDQSLAASELCAPCERAIASGQFASWGALARACGYMKKGKEGKGDTTRLKRMLGLSRRQRAALWNPRIHRASALKIIEALGLDPVDFNL